MLTIYSVIIILIFSYLANDFHKQRELIVSSNFFNYIQKQKGPSKISNEHEKAEFLVKLSFFNDETVEFAICSK